MKRLLLAILCLFILLPVVARSESFLRGRVLDIDRQKGEITVAPLPCRECFPGRPDTNIIKPPTESDENSGESFIVSTDFIPPCVAPDAIVHVWGEMTPAGANRFQAARITGPGWRHDRDSTGVRSRIRKRCLMRQDHNPQSGEK
ncbi:MAG: hypothetical protein V1706_02650 [Pseudomonadota bacterium]